MAICPLANPVWIVMELLVEVAVVNSFPVASYTQMISPALSPLMIISPFRAHILGAAFSSRVLTRVSSTPMRVSIHLAVVPFWIPAYILLDAFALL